MRDINIPRTYSDWVEVIDLLESRTQDEDVLIAMQKGTIEWQTGVAERFSRKLINMINYRMNSASDKFQLDMSRARGEERLIVNALLKLRREMQFLARVFDIDAIPEKDREQYYNLVTKQADMMQNSLEDSAKSDRSGKLLSIVKNNRVNAF